MAPTGFRQISRAALLSGALLAGPWAGFAPIAHAALGARVDSVERDRVHMAARMSSTPSATSTTYTVHTLTLTNGGTVKEFIGGDGVVFAVSWRGQGRPDLRQLLGDGFDRLQAETAAATGARTKTPIAVDRGDFVVHTGGHPGAVWGHAYLTQKVPTGFSGQDLQ